MVAVSRQHLTLFMVFPDGSDGEESTCSAQDLGSVPGLGRSPGEGEDYPHQYSGLENSIDREVWQTTNYGVTKNQTRLSDFHLLNSYTLFTYLKNM